MCAFNLPVKILCIYRMTPLEVVTLALTSLSCSFSQQAVSQMLMAYLSRLSVIADNKINCGPALTWMEVLISYHLSRNSWLFIWITSEDEGCSLNIYSILPLAGVSYLSLSPGWQQRESLAGAWGVIHKCSSYCSGPRDQALHCPGSWWAVIWGDWDKNEDRLIQYWRCVIVILIMIILWRVLIHFSLSFSQVGDIVSVIDMPPKEDTTWWRGKHGFQVCSTWFSPLFQVYMAV